MNAPRPNPLLQKLDHLLPLTAEEQVALDGAFSRELEYGADEDLVLEGDRPTECHLLLEGMTARYQLMPDGKRQIFSFHVPGDIYDAQSFLLDRMDHNVGTITTCKVAVISHATMRKLTEKYPRIARAIWKETLIDGAIFRQWMANIGRRSAYQRIAHLMCEMYVKFDTVGRARDGCIAWPITQTEMGDALGLSLVHVNRTLMELRGEGLITLKNASLTIHDWERMEQAGQFDPAYLHLTPKEPSASANGHPPSPPSA